MADYKIPEINATEGIYLSNGDLEPNCNSCYCQSTKIGILHVDNVPHDVVKCNGCQRLQVKTSGGIKRLIEIAKERCETDLVSFTASTSSVTNNSSNYTDNSNLDNNVSDISNGIQNSNNYLSNMSYKMQELLNVIQNLNTTVTDLVQKNYELTEKIATDPLISIRKNINDFNLV